MPSPASRVALLVLFLESVATAGQAQELAGSFDQLRVLVKSGDTVRVTDSSGREVRGAIAELSPSSLSLRVSGNLRAFLEGDITTIHQRRPDSLANGAKWGFDVGAGLGVLGGMAIATEYRDGGVAMIPILALVYGGIGAGTGAGIDALHSSEQPIYATRRASGKVALRPILTGGRKGVAASLGFGGPLRPLKAPAADAAAELPPHLSSRLVADLDFQTPAATH